MNSGRHRRAIDPIQKAQSVLHAGFHEETKERRKSASHRNKRAGGTTSQSRREPFSGNGNVEGRLKTGPRTSSDAVFAGTPGESQPAWSVGMRMAPIHVT